MSQPPAATPEFALGLRAFLLEGFKRETAITRKVIAAVSDVQFLTSIANLKFDMTNPAQKPRTITEVVAFYDENVHKGIARVEAMTGEQLLTPLQFAGVFNMPAVFYLGFLNNHSIHHRGELATYLRPMGSKVPSIYGGSFDEPFQMPKPEPAGTAA